ncbi:MAG: glycogen phosphorylase [Candidatus Margulisiibacteriota bacterium]|nr:MAG: glycogen phosphorylase [Candidatus Margulisiibacteriota bacterium]HCY35883.1 glycogen phosphorylase [Candidatus Margulisiibacteriota bacterium]
MIGLGVPSDPVNATIKVEQAVNVLREKIEYHLKYTMGLGLSGTSLNNASKQEIYTALSLALRERIMEKWIETNDAYIEKDVKQLFYFSQEYLMGRALSNNLINLGAQKEVKEVIESLGYNLNEIEDVEMEAGLGNGGLGRLAACFLDSLASLKLPGHGYGLYYQYGIFKQTILNGYQVENPDEWLKYGNPWAIINERDAVKVQFGGRLIKKTNQNDEEIIEMEGCESVCALPFDVPVVGFSGNVNTLRLWHVFPDYTRFDIESFNQGNYPDAFEFINPNDLSITAVLYPNDNHYEGKRLRLKQEYALVSASLQDIIRKFEKTHKYYGDFPQKIAIQINDTHPALVIPELMRILVIEKKFEWDEAWEITTNTIAYTNHTVLPEALEEWPVHMIKELLPLHFDILEEINEKFCDEVRDKYKDETYEVREDIVRKMSIIENGSVRMAHLAIVGSHSVNGVAALHTQILKDRALRNFYIMYPEKFNNKTNGVTPRRWLLKSNPLLSELITSKIGFGWISDLSELKKLESYIDDEVFINQLMDVKAKNKEALTSYIFEYNPVKDANGEIVERIEINPDSIFDVHAKRLHEYKRQLMNALHIMMLHNEIKENPDKVFVPRTFIFAAKAAPGYQMAKDIIKFINILARRTNNAPELRGLIKVVFLENYNVSLAEKLIPAADLSEQISTAGFEASGTGNMKFALNGSLTIGTMDGANVEMAEEIGEENLFIFGMRSEEVKKLQEAGTYNPWNIFKEKPEVKKIIDQLFQGILARDASERTVLQRLANNLMHGGDFYYVLEDLSAYKAAQDEVAELYKNRIAWGKKALLNIARVGKFSSDRTILEYNKDIWGLLPVSI